MRIILMIPLLLIAVLLIRFIFSYFIKEQGRIRLRLYALITLISGWTLYYVGFFFGGTSQSLLASVVRPLIAAIGMFVGNTEYQELSRECRDEPGFMTLFAVIHLSAILVSAIFVINFFWKRSKSYLQGKWWYFIPSDAPLNIFFGLNEQSITLARDIQKEKQGKEHIIFIDLTNSSDEQKEGLSLSQLFGFSNYHQEYINQLAGVNYTIKSAFGSLSDMESEDGNILELLHLRTVKKLIERHSQTRCFLLYEQEDDNIKSAINLMQDAVCKEKQIDIYCLARKNKENSVVEKMAYLKQKDTHPNIHLLDIANLSIQQLKNHVEYQPISFVSPNTKKGVVENSFNALVIGFGETGRDAVRYLYEFGAFPNLEGRRSLFKCYAVDKQIDQLAGSFYNNSPALLDSKEIELLKMDEQSMDFWRWVDGQILMLNYIIIAIGNDKKDMQIAIDILDKAMKKGKDMSNFKIFIRTYSKENESWMKEMAHFYNQKLQDVFVIFGTYEELYTYKNIIDEDTLRQAKEFYAGYTSKKKDDPTWEQRHLICEKEEQDGVSYRLKEREKVTLDDINAVIRKENQDIANSRHIDTKLTLVGLSRKSKKEDFDKLTDEQKKNLAICEHLRWCASHEMTGYVWGEKDDNLRKTHSCLKPWQDLTKDYQAYDYQVMDRTIDIIINAHEDK